MALVIGLIAGLFILLGLALMGAGLRNPRWIIFWFCMLAALYKYGESKLVDDVQDLSISAMGPPNGCMDGEISVVIRNGDTRRIEQFGFELEGFLPNHSSRSAYQYLNSDRIIPAGQSWSNCWRVEELKYLPQPQRSQLRWGVQITSVEFAE
ncbi:MAG: hypothetical protein WA790_19630 [Sulfitobacter sp.]